MRARRRKTETLGSTARITLKPVNPAFAPIVLKGADEQQLQVVAELVEVLSSET
jgi:SOS-response transcriptional repressor LexA